MYTIAMDLPLLLPCDRLFQYCSSSSPLPSFTIHIKSSSMQQISQLHRKTGGKELRLKVHFLPGPKGGAVAFTVKDTTPANALY